MDKTSSTYCFFCVQIRTKVSIFGSATFLQPRGTTDHRLKWRLAEILLCQPRNIWQNLFFLSLSLSLSLTIRVPFAYIAISLFDLYLYIDFILSLSLFGFPLFNFCLNSDVITGQQQKVLLKTNRKGATEVERIEKWDNGSKICISRIILKSCVF